MVKYSGCVHSLARIRSPSPRGTRGGARSPGPNYRSPIGVPDAYGEPHPKTPTPFSLAALVEAPILILPVVRLAAAQSN